MSTWHWRWDKTYKCETSNAGTWFIGMGFSKFYDFSIIIMIFQSSMTYHYFSRNFFFPGFPDPVGTLNLRFDRWPWKTKGHFFYATSSFVHHFTAICVFILQLQSKNAQSGSKSTIFLCNVTLKFDGWHWKTKGHLFLFHIKICASFHHHMWIQTGVMVWKRLSWVLTSVTLTFDLWPWPLAWTSLLSMVIIGENFMMIRWQENCQKVWQTDRRMDGWTEPLIELLGRN